MTPKLDKIKQMIKDHEKKGYATEFHCGLNELAELQTLAQASRELDLRPPMSPGKPWKLMGRDLRVVTDRPLELTATAKKGGR